jgi:hypothetical protein
MFVYMSGSSSADNGGTIIVVSSGEYRYYRKYNNDSYNICWFGASANSSVDSAPALNAALAALPYGGGAILFPPGVFTFNSNIFYTTPREDGNFSVSIIGRGSDVSELYWPATSGITVNVSLRSQSVRIRDMSVTSGRAGGYTGVEINLLSSGGQFGENDVSNVTLRGQVIYSEYWGTGLLINGLSNVDYNNVLYYGGDAIGNGISIAGSSSLTSIVHNLTGCGLFDGGYGLVYGNYVQGVTVSQCNFTNGVTGIFEPAGPGGYQLTVIGSQFNNSGHQMLIETSNAAVSIIGNLFFVPNTPGKQYGGVAFASDYIAQVQIQGNAFTGVSTGTLTGLGVIAGANSYVGVVTGNSFNQLSVGVDLVGATNWNVQANVYNSVNFNVIPGTGNSVGVATK